MAESVEAEERGPVELRPWVYLVGSQLPSGVHQLGSRGAPLTRWNSERRRRRSRDERGSTSLFFVVIVIALFAVIGLVVDGGGKIRSLQRADSVANEAARAGGQALQAAPAIEGSGAVIDPQAAKQAAQAYLAAAGVEGSVDIINGTRLKVTVTTHYNPIFLDLIGAGSQMTTTGAAEVRLVRGIAGQELP